MAKNCFGPRKKFVFCNFIMMFQIQYFSLCGGMVDVSVLGTDVNRRVGSSPTKGSSLPPKGRPSCDKKRSSPCPNLVFPQIKLGDRTEINVFQGRFCPIGPEKHQSETFDTIKVFFFNEKNLHLGPKFHLGK